MKSRAMLLTGAGVLLAALAIAAPARSQIAYVPNGRRYTIDRLDLDMWIEKCKEEISLAA